MTRIVVLVRDPLTKESERTLAEYTESSGDRPVPNDRTYM